MTKKIYILGLIFFSLNLISQTTSIGLQKYESNTYDGYTLFTPADNFNVYLVNNCGEKVHEWLFTEKPGATCYILENGNLLRAGKDNIEIRDWDNNIVWTYATTSNGILQHHDIEPLPNGNILCIANDSYSLSEITAVGRNPLITANNFKLDRIVEIQPIGTNGANIVWEWKFFDHFIQDFDNTKPNYGVVADHAELIDLNFDNGYSQDWTHVNGIDYNATLDQIIISTRHLNEIYIIDHSTTTIEAASHNGGNSNKGGDILWRWGNPQVYRQGTQLDQKLFLQHDSKWVEDGYLDSGKISVFNNGGDGNFTFSSVHLIEPEIIGYNYTLNNNKFIPEDFDWSWSGSFFGNIMQQGIKSGCHSLPNGNFIICETSLGRISEIDKNGNHLWSYRNPSGSTNYLQGDLENQIGNNGLFRGEKYPKNYIGFMGKDLTPYGIIENVNTISDICISSLDTDDFENINSFVIINPVSDKELIFTKSIQCSKISFFDTSGKLVDQFSNFEGQVLKTNVTNGLYFIHFEFEDKIEIRKIIID